MSTLTQLQALVRNAIGNQTYTAATITGHLNQGCREAAALVRLPGLSASRPLTISYKRGGVILTATEAVKIYSVAHGLSTGDIVMPSLSKGTTEVSNNVYRVTVVDANNFTLDTTVYNGVEPNYTAAGAATVSGVTLTGSDVQITTSAAHGFATGDIIYFGGFAVGSTEELNGNYYTITVTDGTNFTLDNTTPANYSAWTTGGTAYHSVTIYTPWVALPTDFDFSRKYNVIRAYSKNQGMGFDYSRAMGLLDSWDLFTEYYPVFDETGAIEHLCVYGNKLWFHPMPSSDTLIIHHQRVPTDMVDGSVTTVDSAFPTWFHNELVHFSAGEIYEEQGQLEMAALHRAQWSLIVNDKGDGRLQMFVGPDDTPPKIIEEEGEFYATEW